MSNWKKIMIAALCVIAVGFTIFMCLVAYSYYKRNKPYDDEVHKIQVSEHITMEYKGYWNNNYARLKDNRTGEYTTPALQHIFLNEYNDIDSLVVFRTKDNKRGYVNINTGKIIIPAQYERAWNFSEGVAAVMQDGVISFIDIDGKPIMSKTFPIYFDEFRYSLTPQFNRGLCIMRTIDNKWGLIDKQGEWVVEPIYNSIYMPSANGNMVFTDGMKFGILAKDGSTLLPLEYDDIRTINETRLGHIRRGYLLLKDGYAKEVDTNLNTVTPFVYDELSQIVYRRSEYSEVPEYSDKYFRYDVGRYSGVIDINGKVILPAKYYMIKMFNDDLFEVQYDYEGHYAIMDKNGHLLGQTGN